MLLQVLDSDAKLPPNFKDKLYQAIAAASGAVQKEEAKARKAVATEGEERTGTGPFDNLTMEAHVNIFSALGLRDRLTVSIAVCKAWRAFRTQLELWRDIGGLAEGDNRYRSRAWVHGHGMIRLMSWLPTNAAHTLSIAMHNKHDDKAIDAASICAAMKNLRGWKGGRPARAITMDGATLEVFWRSTGIAPPPHSSEETADECCTAD